LLDNDELRRAWLTEIAAGAGRGGFVVADDIDVRGRRDAQLDLMADLLAAHLDLDAVMDLVAHGAPSRPTMSTALLAPPR
jgi:adenosylcobyric acid synthase